MKMPAELPSAEQIFTETSRLVPLVNYKRQMLDFKDFTEGFINQVNERSAFMATVYRHL